MAKDKKQRGSTKGIPDNLRPLAESGQRVRFNGGWLGDTAQDRFLANWIDNTPNAWAVMKHILYQVLNGNAQTYQQPQIAPAQDDIYTDELNIGDAGRALLDFDD
jgi:hypothetical protein